MNGAVTYIISMSMLVSLSTFMLHKRQDNKISRFAVGIIFLASLITPLSALLSAEPDFVLPEFEPDCGSEEYISYMEEGYSEGITAALAEELSIDREDIRVVLDGFNADSITAEKCTVILRGRGALCDFSMVKRLVLRMGVDSCEVEVSL